VEVPGKRTKTTGKQVLPSRKLKVLALAGGLDIGSNIWIVSQGSIQSLNGFVSGVRVVCRGRGLKIGEDGSEVEAALELNAEPVSADIESLPGESLCADQPAEIIRGNHLS
jgi:hypothetical protein